MSGDTDLSADGRWFTIKLKFACLQLKEVGGLKVLILIEMCPDGSTKARVVRDVRCGAVL